MSKVTVTVDIDQFKTGDLLKALIDRIDDYLHDPEPKHDPYLQNLSKRTLEEMLRSLRDS